MKKYQFAVITTMLTAIFANQMAKPGHIDPIALVLFAIGLIVGAIGWITDSSEVSSNKA